MSGHSIHDLERKLDSFTANIGADDDGNETAYLYHPEKGKYVGCVTFDEVLSQYTFDAQCWPDDQLTEAIIADVHAVIGWLRLREHMKLMEMAETAMTDWECFGISPIRRLAQSYAISMGQLPDTEGGAE